jgi:predicted transcriptional regulator of viral defense system
MENKKRKSGGQKEIYLSALKNKVITVSEARQIVKNDNTARMALWRLTKDGHLVREIGRARV